MIDLGQVFTKKNVASFMVSLFDLDKNAKMLDPCFGGGVFLDTLLHFKYENITGCEIDKNLYINAKNKYYNCNILNKDFLDLKGENEFDGIIMNPPYIRQEKINDLKDFGITKKKLRENALYSYLPSTANVYMYFIVKAISLLKDKGQLIVIFPSSWMNSKNGCNFKKYLNKQCGISKKVFIYGEVFEKQALVDVVILKLIKNFSIQEAEPEYYVVENGKLIKKTIKEHASLNLFDTNFQSIASIKRGITTGYNEMFINPEVKCPKATEPIISSPKSIKGYSTKDALLDKILCVSNDNNSLEVRNYLEVWKNIIINNKQPITLYRKIEKNQRWYEIRKIPSEGIIFGYFVRNEMKFIINDSNALIRDNFYIIYPKINIYLMFALLNNFYTYYQLELSGKKYGAGLLKLQRYDLENLKFPNPESIENNDIDRLIKLSKEIKRDNNSKLIKDITAILSKYSQISSFEIEKQYNDLKNTRLEVNK